MATKRATNSFGPRVRFNWGFHDAQLGAEQGWPNRQLLTRQVGGHCPLPAGKDGAAYRAGYAAGWAAYQETGVRSESSEDAWQAQMLVAAN